jgi:anti-anti-sigma factor
MTDAALMGRMLKDPERVADGCCRRVPSMEIQITPIPSSAGSLGIALRGRISYREAPELRQTVLDTLARKDVASVIVDLAQVDRMDTSGVAVLVEALMGGRKRNVTMMLCAPSPSVIEIFHLAGLDEALRCCCATPAEAHRRLAKATQA